MTRSIRFSSHFQGAVALAVLALGAGCAAEPVYAGPPSSPTYVENASVPAGAVAAPPDPQVDTEVIEVAQPPVVDIETYPSVEYEGATVFFVGGQWYRRGPHGWAYFREEPRELARQREAHEREPRWVQARQAPSAPAPVPRAEGMTRPEEPRAAPARPEERRPESRALPERRTEPVPATPSEDRTGKPVEKKETKKGDESDQPPTPPRPKASRRPARSAQPAPRSEPERR